MRCTSQKRKRAQIVSAQKSLRWYLWICSSKAEQCSVNMAEAFDGHILESSTRHQNVAEQIGMSCKKKNIVFRNLVYSLVYSLFLSQFRRFALQACDELKSKYLWNATKGLRWANLLPMKRAPLTSGVCTFTLWPALSWNIRHGCLNGWKHTSVRWSDMVYYIYIGIVHITRLIPGVCTYLHPVTGDRSGRLLTNPELSLLPLHLPVWWPVHETWFQNNFILRVELTRNNRVILLQWAAV